MTKHTHDSYLRLPARPSRAARETWLAPVGVCALFFFWATVPIAADTIKFLPDENELPKTLKDIDPTVAANTVIRSYVGDKVRFEQNVVCPVAGCNFPAGTKIGTLQFDFAAYTGLSETDDPSLEVDTVGGAAIRGGFIFDDGFELKDGFTLRWIQTVRSIIPGQPDIEEVDNEVDGSPFYTNFTLDGVDALLFDVPRNSRLRNITKSFESALVCVGCDSENGIKYLGSFLWGYSIMNLAVTGIAPGFWGPPTQSFIHTVQAEFPDIDLEPGCCVVPEPGSLTLLALGVVAIRTARLRRAVRRRNRRCWRRRFGGRPSRSVGRCWVRSGHRSLLE